MAAPWRAQKPTTHTTHTHNNNNNNKNPVPLYSSLTGALQQVHDLRLGDVAAVEAVLVLGLGDRAAQAHLVALDLYCFFVVGLLGFLLGFWGWLGGGFRVRRAERGAVFCVARRRQTKRASGEGAGKRGVADCASPFGNDASTARALSAPSPRPAPPQRLPVRTNHRQQQHSTQHAAHTAQHSTTTHSTTHGEARVRVVKHDLDVRRLHAVPRALLFVCCCVLVGSFGGF